MKFIIKKEILSNILQALLGPATAKQNIPVLNGVLISVDEGGVKFTTTDLEMTLIFFQKAQVLKKGEVTVPVKRLLSVVREMPPTDIVIEKNKNTLLVKCEKIEFRMNTLNSEEFPKIEEKKETSLVRLNPQDLKGMIGLTSFCVGYEDSNYVLSGILFEIFQNKLSLVSTDGKRLSFITKKLPSSQPEVRTKISFILPLKTIHELNKLIKDREGDVFLFVEDGRVGFDLENIQLIARPIEGEFPSHTQYIPQEGKDKMVVNREAFLFSLKRAALLSTPDYQGVKLEFKKDSANISKNTPQLGGVEETFAIRYNGPALAIGFNPAYLTDVLKNLNDDEVCFEFFGPDKPAVLRKEGYVYLVLPMKL